MKLTGHWSVSSVITVALTAASFCAAFAVILSAGLAVMSLFAHVPGGTLDIPVWFHVDGQTLPVTAPSLGVRTAEIYNVNGSLRFQPQAANSVVPVALLGVSLMCGLVLWPLGELRAVFRTLHNGQPFVAANAGRIRSVGLAVIVVEIGRATLVFLAHSYALTHFTARGLRFDAHFGLNFFTILSGVIILVIAEVFRAGTQLAEDQSLTI